METQMSRGRIYREEPSAHRRTWLAPSRLSHLLPGAAAEWTASRSVTASRAPAVPGVTSTAADHRIDDLADGK